MARSVGFVRTIVLCAAVCAGVTAVMAQQDPIAERKKLMKAQGAAVRDPGLMLKGDQPFNLEKVQAGLRTLLDTNKRLPPLWPDNSKTGGETEALPAIWEQREKFDGLLTKLGTDSEAALAAIKDEASFKAEFPKVVQNCGGCHNTFRAKK
jgi:cytochrome c556